MLKIQRGARSCEDNFSRRLPGLVAHSASALVSAWRAQAQDLRMARSQRPRQRPGMLPASLSPAAMRPSLLWAARRTTRAVCPAVTKVRRQCHWHLSRSSGELPGRTVSSLRGRGAYRARPWRRSPSSAIFTMAHKCLTPGLGVGFRCQSFLQCRSYCRPAPMYSTARGSRLVRPRWRRLVRQDHR